jgi:hypothetical protein
MNLISPYDILCYHVGKWYQSSVVYAVSELDAMLLDNVVLSIANFYSLFSWETSSCALVIYTINANFMLLHHGL